MHLGPRRKLRTCIPAAFSSTLNRASLKVRTGPRQQHDFDGRVYQANGRCGSGREAESMLSAVLRTSLDVSELCMAPGREHRRARGNTERAIGFEALLACGAPLRHFANDFPVPSTWDVRTPKCKHCSGTHNVGSLKVKGRLREA